MPDRLLPFEEFLNMEMRIGRITKAEPILQSQNLIRIVVDIGGDLRQAVAGIAKHYSPKDLEAKRIAVITNLQPKKIFGIESNVMILAAEDGEIMSLLTPDRPVKTGSRIR